MHKEIFVGLMSGTSMDGIDAVLADFSENAINLIASHSQAYPEDLKQQLEALVKNPRIHLDDLGQLNTRLGQEFARCVNQLLLDNQLAATEVTAIGSHGQTIWHNVAAAFPFSLQIGDPNVITALTGITTVSDFRSKDIALGGQGAPLVPAFHQRLFSQLDTDRAIVNIGGISNITLLTGDGKVFGHDCGPGNTLMDLWAQKHIGMPFDHSGAWAKQGLLQRTLLLQMLTDQYFKQASPKSTGREYFNLNWLDTYLTSHENMDVGDVQTTLCELTAQSIATDVLNIAQEHSLYLDHLIICGGGSHNQFLLERLDDILPLEILTSDRLGYPADWIEALAFAWFAKNTLNQQPSNVPSVTGASAFSPLGQIVRA